MKLKVKHIIFFMIIFIVYGLSGCGVYTSNTETDESSSNTSSLEKKEEVLGDVIASGDTYSLRKYIVSGFDNSSIQYGIYNSDTGTWTLPLAELTYPITGDWVQYSGDGTFLYVYGDGEYKGIILTPSAEDGFFCIEKESFPTDNIYTEEIYFKGGKTIQDLRDGERYLITTDGQFENIGYPSENRFGSYGHICYQSAQCMVFCTHASGFLNSMVNREKAGSIFLYNYDKREYVYLDKKYDDKIILSKDSYFSSENGVMRISNIIGADNNYYYIEFDLDGNTVTEPTRM